MAIKPAFQTTVIDKHEMQRLISRNLVISVLAKIFQLVTRVFIPPLTLYFVSLEEYGIWAICFVLISYLGLGAFGVSNVYIRYVAEYHARQEIEKINKLVSTGTLIVTVISLLLLIGFWFLLPTFVEETFKIPEHLQQTAFIFFYVTACIFMLNLSLGAFIFALNGLQKIAETTIIWIGCLTLETVLIVVLLFMGFGIYALLYAVVIRYVVSIVAHTVLSYKLIPGLSIGIQHIDWSYLKLFYRYGGILQLLGTLSIFIGSIDKLVAGSAFSMQATALIDTGKKFPVMAASMPASMNAVFLPATAYMYSQRRNEELLSMYMQGSRFMNLLTGFMMGYLAAFAPLIVAAWLGTKPEFQMAAIIMTLFTLPQQIHIITGPGTAFFNGTAHPARTLFYPIVNLIVIGVMAAAILLWSEMTLMSLMWLVVLSTIVSALAYIFYTNHKMRLSQWTYFVKVLVPGLIPYAVGYLVLWLMYPWVTVALQNRWYALQIGTIGGIIYTILTVFVIWAILNAQEREYLRHQFAKSTKYFIRRKNKKK